MSGVYETPIITSGMPVLYVVRDASFLPIHVMSESQSRAGAGPLPGDGLSFPIWGMGQRLRGDVY